MVKGAMTFHTCGRGGIHDIQDEKGEQKKKTKGRERNPHMHLREYIV